jgi:hypothetical protein
MSQFRPEGATAPQVADSIRDVSNMNKRNDASGYVHERARGLERIPTINLGSRSDFIRTPLLQSAIKSGRLPSHAPKAFDLQL